MTANQITPGSMPFHHGFYEVFLPVTDIDRALEFYVKKLGFQMGWRENPSRALLLHVDGEVRSMLGLFQVEAIERRHHISFRVAQEDVDQMVTYLRDRGIEPVYPPSWPTQGPMSEPIVHGWMPAAAVFFKDPDGHLLELIAELAEAPRPEFRYRGLSEWRLRMEEAK